MSAGHPSQDGAGIRAERMLAGRQLPREHAEGEDVGARVDFAAAQLLGRHVARRAERDARLGQPRHRRRIGLRLPAGQAEVEHLDLAVAAADHVLRFQIAVDDAMACAASSAAAMSMSVAISCRGGSGPSRSSSRSVRPRTSSVTMYSSPSISSSAKIVAIAGCESAAAARASRVSRARRIGSRVYSGGQRLERDHAAEPLVLRGVDDAHAAAADLLDDAVGPDLPADERGFVRVVQEQLRRHFPGRALEKRARIASWLASSDRTSRASSGSRASRSASRRSRSCGVALEQRVEERR